MARRSGARASAWREHLELSKLSLAVCPVDCCFSVSDAGGNASQGDLERLIIGVCFHQIDHADRPVMIIPAPDEKSVTVRV